MSVHNAEKTLDGTLQSISRQSFQAFSIVVVDDASTDRTAAVLKRWSTFFGRRLRVLQHSSNLGLTKSLNKGLHVITTPYTARIDADDWWHKEKLEKQIAFLESHSDHGIVGCNYVNKSTAGEKQIVVPETDQGIRQSMIRQNPFAHSCVVFRTDLVKKLGGYDETVRYGQDYELWFRCLPRTKFHNLQEFLCYRTTGSGISVDKQRQQMMQVVKTRLKYIRQYHLPLINYFYLLEPMSIILIPNFIKQFKRKVAG